MTRRLTRQPDIPAFQTRPAAGRQPRTSQSPGPGVAVSARDQHRNRSHCRSARDLPVVQIGSAHRARPARQSDKRDGRPERLRPDQRVAHHGRGHGLEDRPGHRRHGDRIGLEHPPLPQLVRSRHRYRRDRGDRHRPSLPVTMGASLAYGTFLNPATAHYPAVVLGTEAARSSVSITCRPHPSLAGGPMVHCHRDPQAG